MRLPSYRLSLSMLLAVALIFSSCSKKKNNFFSRTYHETTTHFNGYFNAREGFNEAVTGFEEGEPTDWEKPLPIVQFPDEQESTSLFPAMDRSIEKVSKVINRHSMLIKKKQYNEWIDDSYLLMGKSHFYKRAYPDAIETFKYITKVFKKEPIRHEANLWLARIAIEKREFARANTLLERLQEQRSDWPKGMDQTFYEVYTHFYMQQEEYKQAIDKLQLAIGVTKKKDRRMRQTFLLAQLYDVTAQSQRSVRTFGEVVKMNPGYEMKFYAQINQALAFDSRSDSEEIRAKLGKMLKDEKYIEFRDQIYYALAEVEFAERNTDAGIQMLLRSAEASVSNPKQKGRSFLRLAEIYFEERDYQVAESFYDSTITYLPADYPNYEIVKATKESLTDLVFYLDIVYMQDSLQTLALMSDADRDQALRGIIKGQRKAERDRQQAEIDKQQREFENRQNLRADQQQNRGPIGIGGSGKWYFYNEGSKGIGFTEFRAKFGERPLKDNWRRKNKSQILAFDDDEDDSDSTDTEAGKLSEGSISTLDELRSAVPLDDAAMQISMDTMATALFEIGKIYKDRLEDFGNAIETFEDLNVRLPGNKHEQKAYYQLYRLFLTKEQDPSYFPSDPRSTSAYYASLITDDFPDSEFARLITDPDYLASNEQERMAEVKAYEDVFRKYRQRDYTNVMIACLDVMNNDEGNKLLPKYYLLRAMAIAGKRDRTNFIGALREVVVKFPGTEEHDEAKRLLGLLEEETAKLDPVKDDPKDDKVVKKDEGPKGDYVTKDDMDHYFAMLVPNKGSRMNDVKVKVSNFNGEFFRSETFKVTNSFINSESQILLVRTFKDRDKAMEYLRAYQGDSSVLAGVNDQGHETFVITSKNFATLFKTKDIDGYIEFFKAKYQQ